MSTRIEEDFFEWCKLGDNDKISNNLLSKFKVNINCMIHGLTPLHVASCWGKLDTIKLLIRNGADVTIKTQMTNKKCYEIAIEYGELKVANFLLLIYCNSFIRSYSNFCTITSTKTTRVQFFKEQEFWKIQSNIVDFGIRV